jgi:asparagine synthase (glutamine-hydrolysing)
VKRFIALSWRIQDAQGARGTLARLLASLRLDVLEDGLALLVDPKLPAPIRRLTGGRGFVIGDLFDGQGRPAPELVNCGGGLPQDICRALTASYWGRYVALINSDDASTPIIYRDPSGGLDCLCWRAGSVGVVASHLESGWLAALRPMGLGIDWSMLADFLIDPVNIGGQSALHGVEALAPGRLSRGDGEAQESIWTPARFTTGARMPIEEAADNLERVVDSCVGAHATAGGPLLSELSGGLDSAIVAAATKRCSDADVRQWLNYYASDRAGDERDFALAMADQLDVELVTASKPELTLDVERLDDLPFGVRPSLNGLDAHYDRDVAQRCGALHIQSILTGQGGDALFMQGRSAAIAVDARHLGVRRKARIELSYDLARWGRCSIWSVASQASRTRGSGLRRPASFVARELACSSPTIGHPWLTDLDQVPPAKRHQIYGLAAALLVHGECRRSRAADLIHPLLSQPVIELCLGIPTFDLTGGRRDRALARETFANRLPLSIVMRRSKGDLTAYYGRMLGRSLPLLRPWLLEGVLASRSLLDRDALDAILTEDHLIWRGDYPDLMELIALEAWARGWTRQLP